MRAILFGAALLLLGCQNSRSVECGAATCPEGHACHPSGRACVLQAQLDRCSGQVDGASCSVPSLGDGVCLGQVCELSACGDGVVSGAEACDDGNFEGADGCSGDCRSDETCGNGVIDQLVGEACDDGNTTGGDGCQASCALPGCGDGFITGDEACDDGNNEDGDGCNAQCTSDETCGNGVVDVELGEECDGSEGCSEECLVARCGNNRVDPGEECDDGNNASGDTCGPTCLNEECGNGFVDPGEQCDDGDSENRDGCHSSCRSESAQWAELTQRPPGPNTRLHYDPLSRSAVLFGGVTSGTGISPETWRFDGHSWNRVGDGQVPGANRNCTMAFDQPLERMVMLCDDFFDVEPSATFEFDGNDWVEVAPYPVGSEACTVFPGGPQGSLAGCPDSELYRFEDRAWTSIPAPSTDDGRFIFDPTGDRTLKIVGGDPPTVWSDESGSWAELVTTNPPGSDLFISEAKFDPSSGRIVVLANASETQWETWFFEGTAWTMGISTAAAHVNSVVYHPALGKLIGLEPEPVTSETMLVEWSGAAWVPVAAAVGPQFIVDARLTYDSRRDQFIAIDQSNDWWAFQGAWRPYPVTGAPADCLECSLTYDAGRDRFVLLHASNDVDDEVYEAVGTDFQLVTSGELVDERSSFGIYDAGQSRTLWFHGQSVYSYNGSTVSQLSFVGAGARPNYGSLAWDPVERRAIQVTETIDFGVVPPLYHDRLWFWSDGTWTSEMLPADVPRRAAGSTVFHERRGSSIVAGGRRVLTLSNQLPDADSWIFDDEGWVELPRVADSSINQSMVYRTTTAEVLWHGQTGAGIESRLFSFSSSFSDEICRGGEDDDGDDLVDCEDPDCRLSACGPNGVQCLNEECVCPYGESTETKCDNGYDDDCDGLSDCADPDCGCPGIVAEDCDDGVDNDGDGLIDCEDEVDCLLWSGYATDCP